MLDILMWDINGAGFFESEGVCEGAKYIYLAEMIIILEDVVDTKLLKYDSHALVPCRAWLLTRSNFLLVISKPNV